MKTRQKINHRKKENQILDLLGNLFQVKSFSRLYLDFPFKKGKYCYTRDTYSGKVFNLIHTHKDIWYAVFYLVELDMYLLKKLILLEYNSDTDIRKAYEKRKRRRK